MVKLEDYSVTQLKKMISSFNKKVKFAGYSKMKKAELINMLRSHPRIKVVEGSADVKISIKQEENFEKQTKKKKEVIMKPEPKKPEPKKPAPNTEPKKPAPKGLKIELSKVLNKHYGGIVKYEKKVLSGKLIDESPQYEAEWQANEDEFNDNIKALFVKYNLSRMKGSEFFRSSQGGGTKHINLIKYDKLPIKSLPNYKILTEVNKKIEAMKPEPMKPEPKKPAPKINPLYQEALETSNKDDKLLKRLVATARSHAKNGISIAGLKDFFSNLTIYRKTKPPKLNAQLAGVLYKFLNKNIFRGKKRLPNNMNRMLKDLGYKEIKT